MIRQLLTGVVAVSMTASPVLAQAAAPPLAVVPAAESVGGDGSSELSAPGSPIAPILFATIIAFGVLLAIGAWPFDDDDDEESISA